MAIENVDQFIAGKRTSEAGLGGKGGSKHTVLNPATGEAIAQAELDSKRSAEAAVEAAREAFPKWSATAGGRPVPGAVQVQAGARGAL